MLYNPPSGGALNDPYIGANIAAGIQGSKVPPAAVEFPQRELVSLITAAGLAPTNTDLQQALRAVRSGVLEYSPDVGNVNAPAIVPSPAHTTLVDGLHVRVRMKAAPTGPSTLSVSSLIAPIEYLGAGPLIGGDWAVNDIVDFVYCAPRNAFQFLGLTIPQIIAKLISSNLFQQLVANPIIYVSASGSDANSGTTPSTAKATVAGALAASANYNFATTSLTIQIQGGGSFALPASVGASSGPIIIDCGGTATLTTGGTVNFANLTIRNCVALQNVSNSSATVLSLNGGIFNIATTAIQLTGGGTSSILQTGPGGSCSIGAGVSFAGSGQFALYCNGGSFFLNGATISVIGSPTYSVFAYASSGGLIFTNGSASFSGPASGTRYAITANAVIITNGGGANYYPGSSAGAIASGGQYL